MWRTKRLLSGILVWVSCVCTISSAAADFDHIIVRAIRRGDARVVGSLLRQGTPANLRLADGTTLLMFAAQRSGLDCVQLLLDHGAEVNAVNNAKATALHWAVGDVEKVRLLLQRGANVDARSNLGNTPLIVAAAYPVSTEVVKLLLQNGASIKAKNKRGTTALGNAVTAGSSSTVRLLLERGAQLEDRKSGTSLLSIAAGLGHREIVEMLLERGADPNAAGGRGALNAALLAQKADIARILIEQGAKLDRKLNPGKVPSIVLSAYTETGDTSVARLMIAKGAALSETNQYDETALTWARKRADQPLCELLIEAGTPPRTPTLKHKQIPNRDVELTSSNQSRLLGRAVAKSIDLLQRSSDVFLKNRENCISCHHQNLPSIALGWARDRGIKVDEASIDRMIERQLLSWKPRIDRAYQMDRPVPVAPRFIGYGLLGFAALGYDPDQVTDAMVWYLAAIQQADGHWVPGMLRPPLGGAEIVATVLAMRSLQLYPLEGRREEMSERVRRAADWLRAASPRTHQQRVYQLLGLGWSGESPADLAGLVSSLLHEQRDDGGWCQLGGLKSDAWATGQTLVALHVAGGLPTTHTAYQQGLEFLLRTQFDDGSWYVRTRTWPFQPHFDSQFPHGKDQWISAPATAWSVMAMTLALEPKRDVIVAAKYSDRTSTESRSTKQAVGKQNPIGPASKPQNADRPAAPASPSMPVDFVKQIQPILTRSCVGCHSGSEPKGGFRVTTRKLLIKGGESGDASIQPGKYAESPLIRFVAGQVEDLEMPPLRNRNKFPALTNEQVEILKAWIHQGAVWPQGVNLDPRQ